MISFMKIAPRLQSLLSPGARRSQQTSQAARSLLVRMTSMVLVALVLSAGIMLFPRAASVSAHTTTSQQHSTTLHPQAQVTRQDVFARGTDMTLWHRWRFTASREWSPWQSLGVQLDSAPSVVAVPGSDEIDGTYLRGGHTWFFSYNPRTNQFAQQDLGIECTHSLFGFCNTGLFTAAPAITSTGQAHLEVFAIDGGQKLWHIVRTLQTPPQGGQQFPVWSDWDLLSQDNYLNDPAAIAWGSGRIDVFTHNTNNHLQDKVFQNGHWSLWQDLGGILTSSPSVITTGPGTLTVFVRNTDSGISSRTLSNGSWGPWSTATSAFSYAAPAASPSATGGVFDLFFISVAGRIQGGIVSLFAFSSPTTIEEDDLGSVSSSVFLSSVAAVVGTYP
jgi:hypothetical protein